MCVKPSLSAHQGRGKRICNTTEKIVIIFCRHFPLNKRPFSRVFLATPAEAPLWQAHRFFARFAVIWWTMNRQREGHTTEECVLCARFCYGCSGFTPSIPPLRPATLNPHKVVKRAFFFRFALLLFWLFKNLLLLVDVVRFSVCATFFFPQASSNAAIR